mgnify:CR=1 FL=1
MTDDPLIVALAKARARTGIQAADGPPAPPLAEVLGDILARAKVRLGPSPPSEDPTDPVYLGDIPERFRSLVSGPVRLRRPVEAAFRRVFADLDGPPGPRRGLFLWGPPGVGKTVAACRLVYLLRRGAVDARAAWNRELARDLKPGECRQRPPAPATVAYLTDRDWILENRDAMARGVSLARRLEDLTGKSVLVLDDLASGTDATPYTDFEAGLLGDLVDRVYRAGQLAVMTSNKDLDALAPILGPRIPSRLREMCEVVHLEGRDRRRPT